MFEIKLDKQPEKFLKKCENILFGRIVGKLELLKTNPVPHDSKRITGYELPTFRIRIGKYRALYRINYDTKTIIIVSFDNRENVYL
ncbi:type II toxin-antitoxin system RelE/ParE family toxin [Candidatus Woesearchaeota archaeon]|nr:type II toxin-antitoxin system RelE/ParE family toxin [Candidatus Woesearchaeota archaeon]